MTIALSLTVLIFFLIYNLVSKKLIGAGEMRNEVYYFKNNVRGTVLVARQNEESNYLA